MLVEELFSETDGRIDDRTEATYEACLQSIPQKPKRPSYSRAALWCRELKLLNGEQLKPRDVLPT